jgi:DNA/RNA endonuclease YhcR with UshA esterase domain
MKNLFLVLFVCIGFSAFSQETITASQAKDFVGKDVLLVGKVAGSKQIISKSEQPILFINIDKEYPDNEIVIVVFSEVLSKLKFTGMALSGKTIKVKGKVGIYKEKPQIKVENEANLTIIE